MTVFHIFFHHSKYQQKISKQHDAHSWWVMFLWRKLIGTQCVNSCTSAYAEKLNEVIRTRWKELPGIRTLFCHDLALCLKSNNKKKFQERKKSKYVETGGPSSKSGFQLKEILSFLFNHVMLNLSDLVGKLCKRCQGWEENVTKITIGLILHLAV